MRTSESQVEISKALADFHAEMTSVKNDNRNLGGTVTEEPMIERLTDEVDADFDYLMTCLAGTTRGTRLVRIRDYCDALLSQLREQREALERLHYVTYRTTSDEVWKRSGICAECNHPWPCSTLAALAPVADKRTEP